MQGLLFLPRCFLKSSQEIKVYFSQRPLLKLSSVCPHLQSNWLHTLGSLGIIPFLCSSFPPSLRSWHSLWPERNQPDSLLVEPHLLPGAFAGDLIESEQPLASSSSTVSIMCTLPATLLSLLLEHAGHAILGACAPTCCSLCWNALLVTVVWLPHLLQLSAKCYLTSLS